MLIRVAILFVSLATVPAFAQRDVPLSVTSVATSGYWEANGQSGRYRVVITEEGWEHVTNRLFVEWITEPRSKDQPPMLISTVEPDLPFGQSVAAFSATTKKLLPGCLKISLTGVVSADPSSKVSGALIATAPGQVLQIAANSALPSNCAKNRTAR